MYIMYYYAFFTQKLDLHEYSANISQHDASVDRLEERMSYFLLLLSLIRNCDNNN